MTWLTRRNRDGSRWQEVARMSLIGDSKRKGGEKLRRPLKHSPRNQQSSTYPKTSRRCCPTGARRLLINTGRPTQRRRRRPFRLRASFEECSRLFNSNVSVMAPGQNKCGESPLVLSDKAKGGQLSVGFARNGWSLQKHRVGSSRGKAFENACPFQQGDAVARACPAFPLARVLTPSRDFPLSAMRL